MSETKTTTSKKKTAKAEAASEQAPQVQGQPTPTMPQMNMDNALSILIQAAHKGQKAGAYEFRESALIGQAIEFVQKAAAQAQPKTPKQETKG